MMNFYLKTILITTLGLCLTCVASTAIAASAWFANLQLEITDVIPTAVTEDGLLADVLFEGSANGTLIKDGVVVGVDHVLFDLSGDGHLNVFLTITDKDGDQISANVTGLATYWNSGQYLLQGALGTIIDGSDPDTGAVHATTGKYAIGLVTHSRISALFRNSRCSPQRGPSM